MPPPSGKDIATSYWCDKMGLPQGHPTVRQAVRECGQGACERAYGRLRDKEMDGARPDLKLANGVKDRQAFFIWALKIELQAYWDERSAKKKR